MEFYERGKIMDHDIKLGASLFSLGYEYAAGIMDLKDCIRTAKALGYTGIELVSAQMVPGYPYPPSQWCDDMAAFMQTVGVEPVAYGCYVDKARYSDHDLTDDEIFEGVFNDMLIAARLGFSIVKVNDLIGVLVLRQLIPLAQRLGLWIGVELHQPHTIRDEHWRAYFELFAQDGARHVGVVPDTGIFLRQFPEILGSPSGADFIPASMEDFAYMLRYSRYMHGKFFYVDDRLCDESIDFKTIIKTMKACGFHGYLCAEYEGYFHDVSLGAVTQLGRYRRMMARYLDGG